MDQELSSDGAHSEAKPPLPAVDQLMPGVYDELRQLAHRWFQRQPPGHTLDPTALVHEAYLRLAQREKGTAHSPSDRTHTLALAATAMRQILVSHARRKGRLKRGGDWRRISLTQLAGEGPLELDFESLDRALQTLERLNPRQCRIVDLRFFGGLSIEECAEALGIAPRTVKLDWQMARAWLSREIDRIES